MLYKRNQVEEAISRMMGEPSEKPSTELRTRIKRLLDADRDLGRQARSSDPIERNYAFYSKEAPGKGAEVHFSEYEAFALLEALKLMRHQWPQGFIVSMMREIRRELEKRHTIILNSNVDSLAVHGPTRQRISDSGSSDAVSDLKFMLIVSDAGVGQQASERPYVRFFNGENQAVGFQLEKPGRSCTWLDLISPARSLHKTLEQTLPRQRGRIG